MKHQRRAEKPDARGGTFLLLPHCLLASEAYRTASPRALKVLTAICLRHNGFNNGRIGFSARDLADAIDSQDHAANARAIGELVARGMVSIERDYPKGWRLAREYRVTFIPTETSSATHDYLHWTPGDAGTRKKCDPRGNKRVAETSTEITRSDGETSTAVKQSVGETSAVKISGPEIPPFLECASVGESLTHLVCQCQGSGGSSFRSPKSPLKLVGAISAAPDPDELRDRTKRLLSAIGRGWQNRLAKNARIPAGTLSKFLNHDGPLNEQARIRLTCALPKTEAAARKNDRAT